MPFHAAWRWLGAIALAAALVEPRTAAADVPPATAPATPADSTIVTPGPAYSGHLMKFQALQKLTAGGLYLIAITDDAVAVHIAVSAEVENDITRLLDKQPPGILLDVTTQRLPTVENLPDREIVRSARIYPADPREFEPGVFIFQGVGETYYGKQSYPAVNLRKLGITGAAAIPSHVVAGANQPDPLLMARINQLKDGQLVGAQVQTSSSGPPMLLGIDPYIPPRVGQILGKTQMVSDEFGNETPALKVQWGDETATLPLAAIDGAGKPIPKSQISLSGEFQPGEILRFYFRGAGAMNQIKSMEFDGQVMRPADDRVYFDISDARLVLLQTGRLITGVKLFVWAPASDSEKFLRGVHQLVSQPQAKPPLGLNGAQLALLARIDLAAPPEPCLPDEMESLKSVVREYGAARSGDARRQASQKIFWALYLVTRKREGRFEQLAQRARNSLSAEQFQSISWMGQAQAAASDDPDAAPPTTQPATP